MPIKASPWLDTFHVTWAAGQDNSWINDREWRLKILAGGILHFETKPQGGNFSTHAPHTWKRIDTPSLGRMATQSASRWNGNFYLVWADHDAPPLEGYGGYEVKILDGALLLFQAKTGEDEEESDEGFVIVAPHTWTRLKGSFDFSK
jgi:hypothetical protein